MPVRSESAGCCSSRHMQRLVVTATPGHVKDLPSCTSTECAVLRLFQYLRFVTAGSCEHLANCRACDHSCWNRMKSFLFSIAPSSGIARPRNYRPRALRIRAKWCQLCRSAWSSITNCAVTGAPKLSEKGAARSNSSSVNARAALAAS
jgi:hypothetical protein